MGYDNNVSENWIHWNAISNSDTDKPNGWYYCTPEYYISEAKDTEYPDAYADHYIVREVKIDGKLYDLTVITNVLPLEPGDETAPNMVGFYLDNDLNYDESGWFMPCNETAEVNDGTIDGKYYVINAAEANQEGLANKVILVATQAVQCEGFTDAWQAFAASFGEITETNHPWYVAGSAE